MCTIRKIYFQSYSSETNNVVCYYRSYLKDSSDLDAHLHIFWYLQY